jgi:hypothetical protein
MTILLAVAYSTLVVLFVELFIFEEINDDFE